MPRTRRSTPGAPSAPDGPSVDRRLIADVGAARTALILSVGLGVLTTACVLAQAILLAHLLGWAMERRADPVPTGLIIAFAVALGARAIIGGVGEALMARSATSVTTTLRRSILEAAVSGGPAWLAPHKTGALVTTVTRGLRSLEPYFSRYLPAAVVAALAPPVALIALLVTDPASALIALGLVIVVPFAMIRLGRRAASESDRQWRRLASLSGRTLELLRGLPTLRSLGRVDRGRAELQAAGEAVAESVDATLTTALASGAALEFIAGVGVGLVAMLAGLRLLSGSMTVVPALAVILITPEVFLPLRRAGAEFHASTEGRSAATAAYELIDHTPPQPTVERSEGIPSVFPIEMRTVSVTFPGAGSPALAPMDLTIAAGDHLVLTGASGSGKSTLLHLLSGFLVPTDGTLSFAGHDSSLLEISERRRGISLVPQRPHVFAATLRENLLLGRIFDDDAVLDAIEIVGLSHFADPMTGGLERPLSEAGASMSAGERQRLALARVLLEDRPLVLLDEPTAHLDVETIEGLRKRLAPWLARRTVIEAGHRDGLLGPAANLVTIPDVAVTS
ncbi:MAG: thiol reductant ABC exporter subunit CydD [Actinomycetes bacterium]